MLKIFCLLNFHRCRFTDKIILMTKNSQSMLRTQVYLPPTSPPSHLLHLQQPLEKRISETLDNIHLQLPEEEEEGKEEEEEEEEEEQGIDGEEEITS